MQSSLTEKIRTILEAQEVSFFTVTLAKSLVSSSVDSSLQPVGILQALCWRCRLDGGAAYLAGTATWSMLVRR